MPRPSSVPLAPTANKETAAPTLSQNQAAEVSTNLRLLDSMPLAPDRLTHIGLACAYPLALGVPGLSRRQIRPSSESLTADGSPPQSAPAAFQIASAPR